MTARPWVHAVWHDLLSSLGVEIVGFAQIGNYGRIQIRDRQFVSRRQLLQKIAVANQHGVVSAFKIGRPGDIVERRGLDYRDTNPWQVFLHALDDVSVTFGV